MRVHLIKRQTIEEYVAGHASSKSSFENWVTGINHADWNDPDDIKQTFGSTDFLGNSTNRVVFDVGGNNFRIICKYHFGITKVHLFVCWIGTHAEYNKLCEKSKQYTVNVY